MTVLLNSWNAEYCRGRPRLAPGYAKGGVMTAKLWTAVSCAALLAYSGQAMAQSDELIVTATKRDESIQDVSISVTAISGDDVKAFSFDTADDIAQQTTNLTTVNLFGNNLPNFAIRGVGLNDIAPNNSSPTAVHVDEVFYPFAVMLNFGLFDIERVEVLKGPQGTLYGRNTTAGAVSFFSRKPDADAFAAELTAGYGNYQNFDTEGFVNIPLNEVSALRFSGTYRNQSDGPYYNRHLDENHGEIERYAWRAQFNAQPNEDLEININVHGGRENSDLAQYDMLPSGNATLTGFCSAFTDGTLQGGETDCYDRSLNQEPDTDPFTSAPGFRPQLDLKGIGGVISIEWDAGDFSVASITGLEHFEREVREDADGFPQVIVDDYYVNNIDVFSQELRFTSDTSGPFDWIVGLYYQTDELDSPISEVKAYTRGLALNTEVFQDTETFAAFGNFGYQLSPMWAINGGIRYTYEKRDFEGRTFVDVISPAPTEVSFDPPPPGTSQPFGVPAAERIDSREFNNVSGKIGIDFTPNDNTLIYFSASRGFKSGGFNGNLALNSSTITAFDEETVYAFELGKKLTLADGAVTWNSAVFWYEYKDAQLIGNFLVDIGGGATGNLFALTNLADAKVVGFESDLRWRPTPEWDIRAGVGVLDTKIKNSIEPENNVTIGEELAFAPPVNANGSIRYSREVGSGWMGSVQVDVTHTAKFFTNISNIPVTESGGFTLVNGRASLYSSDTGLQVSFWAKNIFDERYSTWVNNLASTYRVLRATGMPRTFGVELSYAFN